MKRLLLTVALIFVMFSGYSQIWRYQRYEVWGAVSVFQYFGDCGGTADKKDLLGLKDISILANRPGFTIGAIYREDERWYFQISNSFGFFTQTDKGSRNAARNFAFSTIANETSIQGLYFFVKESDRSYSFSYRYRLKHINQLFSAYAFAGFGSLYYKVTPKESLVGSDRFENKHLTMNFPVGVGIKLAFSPSFSFGFDLGRRWTLSDYLDGFTSPWSHHKDAYYIMNFKFYYRLPKAKPFRPIF
jgi:hypothetical protein